MNATSRLFSGLTNVSKLLLVLVLVAAAEAQSLPTNPEASCLVSSTEFDGWFQSGAVTLNGVVLPANSVTFPNTPNCSFYKWSEQMMLWLTSPAPAIYGGGGGRIFASPSFFDVSPPDANGRRTFVPHSRGGLFANFQVRNAQRGPNRLPVVFDRSGTMFEITDADPVEPERPRIRNAQGEMIEVADLRPQERGLPVFLDQGGKAIEVQRAAPEKRGIRNQVRPLRAKRFLIRSTPFFVDLFGNVIDVEIGQAATSAVLMAQNGSLVYYMTTVNDVFAYFRTAVANGDIVENQFPTTQSDLNAIVAFATTNGKTIIDPEALAVEIKTSWVEANGLPNLNTYITTRGTVPTFDTSNPNSWTVTGQKTVTLAMVGIHVVGSTAGHPEMIWATFEHVGNTPPGAYSYVNSSGAITNVPQDTSGSWLFCATNSNGPFNQMHMMRGANNTINSISPHSINPSDTIRWKAFGAASNQSPNPISGSAAASNSEVISINNSVRGRLATGDVRGNYIMTGATWTIGGAAPGGSNQVGTSRLCNSTMETYDQGTDTQANGANCFSCHVTNTTDVSHVFPVLDPLFP